VNYSPFYTPESLIECAEKKISQFDVVSFDLFDTLVVRRIPDPNMVKWPVARFIAEKARVAGSVGWSAEKVLRFRNKVEAMHRRRAARSFPDREARYPDFMADVLGRSLPAGRTGDLLREVTDYELAVESAMIVPRAAFTRFLQKLRIAGKRILVISDIYLPSEHLKRLVARTELGPLIGDVFSSADAFTAKTSGAAWPMIRDRLGLDYSRWLHIGDNAFSDGEKPAACGITSFVLKDTSEKMRKSLAAHYIAAAGRRPFWKGRAVQQLMLPIEAENVARHPLYAIGYNFFGPLFSAYVKKVAEQSRREGLKRLYFLAREGDTFLQIWRRMEPWLFPARNGPAVHYLQVSRLSLAATACAPFGLTPDLADIAFMPPKNRDIRDMCRVFGLDVGALQSHFARYQIGMDEPMSPKHDGWSPAQKRKLSGLLDDPAFQAEVKRQAGPRNEALQLYLESEKFFDQDTVGLVDIGWLGTMQLFLRRSLGLRKDCPRFRGFLLAASGSYDKKIDPDNFCEGFIFDHTRFSFAGSIILTAVNLFEEIARAPHPGIMAYEKKDSGFELVFRGEDDEAARREREQSAYFEPLRQGIFDAAQRFGPASAVLDFEADELKPWLNHLLVSRLAFPKADEVALLGGAHHLDDFAGRHKPLKPFQDAGRGIWDVSPALLRFCPMIKLYYFLGHAICMLRR